METKFPCLSEKKSADNASEHIASSALSISEGLIAKGLTSAAVSTP
jgi:hypothetical protein